MSKVRGPFSFQEIVDDPIGTLLGGSNSKENKKFSKELSHIIRQSKKYGKPYHQLTEEQKNERL